MLIEFYQNKKNPHKYMEIHSDGYGHHSARQVLKFENGVVNYTGDGHLHRWKDKDLRELILDQYKTYPNDENWPIINAYCVACDKWYSYVLSQDEEKAYDKYIFDKMYGKFPGFIHEVFPKMPQHIRAAIQDKNGRVYSCPHCDPSRH